MARRDFTINAIAKRLETGELLDPFNGQGGPRGARAANGLARELPRGPAAPRPRAPLRLRARPRPGRADARADARERRVGAARLGGAHRRRALSATGWGSSRSCCSARIPPRRCGSHVETGVLVALIPEYAPAIGLELRTSGSTAARRAPLRGRPGLRRCGRPTGRASRCAPPRLGKVRPTDAARGACGVVARDPTRSYPARCGAAWTRSCEPDTRSGHGAARRPACARALRRRDRASTSRRRELADVQGERVLDDEAWHATLARARGERRASSALRSRDRRRRPA